MNSRLLMLADRAGFDPYTISGDHEEVLQNFAELIIRECMLLADRPTTLPELTYGELIRKHFGIN